MDFIARYTIALLFIAVILLFILEYSFPLRVLGRAKAQRWTVNLLLSVFSYGAVLLAVRPSGLYAAHLSQSHSFGLFHWIPLNPLLKFIFSFLLLDLTFYYWHRLNHSIPLLWRFHNTHHYDADMDVTTAFRFHFVEIFYSGAFRFIQIFFLGVELPTLVFYDFLFQLGVYFHHSNLKLPYAIEKYCHYFLVTPRFHSVHHANTKSKTDSNFSVLFGFWDHLHKTFNPVLEKPEPVGVPGYSELLDNRLIQILRAPFLKQKKYFPNSKPK